MIFFKKGGIEWQRPTHCKYLILVILSDQWLNATGLTSLVSNTSRSYANRSYANHSRLKIIFVEDWSFVYTNFLIIPNDILPISLRQRSHENQTTMRAFHNRTEMLQSFISQLQFKKKRLPMGSSRCCRYDFHVPLLLSNIHFINASLNPFTPEAAKSCQGSGYLSRLWRHQKVTSMLKL